MSTFNYNDEQILIDRLKKGDEDAYNHLYKLYYSELCTYFKTISGSMDIAEDLVQQAFIKIWKKRNSLVIEHSLKKYLFKIGYNQFVDLKRKSKKDMLLFDQLKNEAVNEMLEYSNDDFEEKMKVLNFEIDKLPTKCKTVFLLGKVNGLKYREISEELNISVKTVERHMTKALKRLRKKLRDDSQSIILYFNAVKHCFHSKEH